MAQHSRPRPEGRDPHRPASPPAPFRSRDSDKRRRQVHPRKVAEKLHGIRQKISDFAKRAGRMEEMAADVRWEIENLQGQLSAMDAGSGAAGQDEVIRFKRDLDLHYRQLAENGTADFRIEFLANGSAAVRVDGKHLTLSTTLGTLLEALASDQGPSPDHLVAWKSAAEITERMARRLGRIANRHALRQNLWRLRRKLETAGVNRYLVQTRGAQMRFALRRHETV